MTRPSKREAEAAAEEATKTDGSAFEEPDVDPQDVARFRELLRVRFYEFPEYPEKFPDPDAGPKRPDRPWSVDWEFRAYEHIVETREYAENDAERGVWFDLEARERAVEEREREKHRRLESQNETIHQLPDEIVRALEGREPWAERDERELWSDEEGSEENEEESEEERT